MEPMEPPLDPPLDQLEYNSTNHVTSFGVCVCMHSPRFWSFFRLLCCEYMSFSASLPGRCLCLDEACQSVFRGLHM